MKLPKTTLALLLPTLSIGLIGCGGGDSDSAPTTTTPKSTVITGQFIDSAVSGLQYDCGDDYNGQTDTEGKFETLEGNKCQFSLNGFDLGSVTVSSDSLVVTPYSIAVDTTKAVKIAALLQSIDADGNPENGISVEDFDGTQLPSNLLDQEEQAFLQALEEVGVAIANLVSFVDAKKHLDGNVPELKGFHSLAVAEIINDVEANLPNLHTLNFQQKLAEYQAILDKGDDSNNADIEVLKAILDIAYILNDDAVKQRIQFDYSQVENPLFAYDSLLPQAIDYAINHNADVVLGANIDRALASTDSESKMLFELANKLVTASDKLAISFAEVNRVAKYDPSDEGMITYQDAHAVRTVALTVANILSTISAYNAGSDVNYLVHTESNVTVKAVKYGYDPDTSFSEYTSLGSVDYQITSVEYNLASYNPVTWMEDPTVFTLRQDPKYLVQALTSLKAAIATVNTKLNLTEYFTAAELADLKPVLTNLHAHLQSPADDVMLFELSDDDVKVTLDILSAYALNTAVGRQDLNIERNQYSCTVDEKLSKVTNVPFCSEEGIRGYYLGNDGQYDYWLEGKYAEHQLEFSVIGGKSEGIIKSCEEKPRDGEFVTCEI